MVQALSFGLCAIRLKIQPFLASLDCRSTKRDPLGLPSCVGGINYAGRRVSWFPKTCFTSVASRYFTAPPMFFALYSIQAHPCSGMYASLIPVSVHVMIEKGLHSPSQKILFGIIAFMFSLSTAYLAVSMAELILLIKAWYLVSDLSESASTSTRSSTEAVLVLFGALVPVDDLTLALKLLRAPIVTLVLMIYGVVATIGVTIFINIDPVNREGRLANTIDVFQEITRYRRWIVENLQRIANKRTKAERLLALIVESGVFYIFLSVTMFATSIVRLPGSHLPLGSLFLQTSFYLAGMYPLIIVILVGRDLTMDKTLLNPTLPRITTDTQPASSQFRASQPAAYQAMSTPMASTQSVAAQRPHIPRESPNSSLSQDSLSSTSSPAPDVEPEIQLYDGGTIE
ncbi:hypothetical protein H4582DRAFT_2131791 [Lactarius indigo]|nr:hypothetical protein H4582DRAFT_2131791 [Lactarius indigo]